MGYQMIGGQMVLVPDNVTPEEIKQVNDDISAGRTPAPTQHLSDEDITRIMSVPGGGSTVSVSSKPVRSITITGAMPPSEIIRQEKSQYTEQKRQEDLRRISEVPTTSGKATSTIPFDRKYYDAIDFGDNAGRTIWRALTPWVEEEGETVKSYIKAVPDMYKGEYKSSQSELKEQYEAEQNNPLWKRLLLGGDTVIKTPDGQYVQIIAGEAPLITPAGRTTKLTQTIAVNYNKILEAAHKTRLAEQWQRTLTYLKAGERLEKATIKSGRIAQNIQELEIAAREAKNTAKVNAAINRLIQDQIDEYNKVQATIATNLAKMQAKQKEPLMILIPGLNINPKEVDKEITKVLINLSPNQALNELNKTGLTTTFAISHPQIITQMINQVSTKTKTNTITELEQEAEELTKPQQKQVTKIIEKIKEQTETQTKTQPKEETKTQTETKTNTKTKTDTITQQTTKQDTPKPPQDKGKDKSSGGTGRGGDFKWPRISTDPQVQKQTRQVVKESDGAIAWRMGKLGGKDRWDVVVNPYTSNEQYYMILGKQPEGATILQRGKGSAYGTTQVVRGTAPKRDVKVDSGIVDVTISPTGKKSVRMKVTPDPQQETTGDITIGKHGRLSEGSPRISRRSGRISPRIPKLR